MDSFEKKWGNPKALRKTPRANARSKAKSNAKAAWQNATSSRTTNPDSEFGQKIGGRKKDPWSQLKTYDRVSARQLGAGVGILGGTGVGTGIGVGIDSAQQKKKNVSKAFKAKPVRITDLKTRGSRQQETEQRYKSKKFPGFSGRSAAVAAGATTPLAIWGGKEGQEIKREQKKYQSDYVKKDYDPKKGFSDQNIAFKDKDARKRVTREYGGRYQADMKNYSKNPERKKKMKREVGAGTVLGGAAGAGAGAKWGRAPKGKSAAIIGGVGAAAGAAYGTIPTSVRDTKYAMNTAAPNAARTAVTSGQKRGDVIPIKNKKEAGSWSGVKKSAFGVDHEIEKGAKQTLKDMRDEKHASTGRHITGGVFPGYHGAIAGKKGHKLKAVGHEVAGSTLGLPAGPAGTITGGAIGTEIAARKGYYKKQKKGAF